MATQTEFSAAVSEITSQEAWERYSSGSHNYYWHGAGKP
jgi:hypothetical protein